MAGHVPAATVVLRMVITIAFVGTGLVLWQWRTRELARARTSAAAARAELAELSTEWNALVQEAMRLGADDHGS